MLVRRGVKYPEIVCNATKSSTSIMFCGSAAEEILPPYVVYKATQVWNTWVTGGPAHTRYNVTASGWFDESVFEDWFSTVFLRAATKKTGPKVLIGDNVAFHYTDSVIKLCKENDIKLVFLPPNSTNLTQPLDVAVFRPVKGAWRQLLREWKISARGRRFKVLPKQEFPSLLKVLWDEITINISANLEKGFQKCGIVPIGVQNLLENLPSYKARQQHAIDESFKEFVLERTQILTENAPLRRRTRKAPIVAGRSVVESESEAEEAVDDPTIPVTSTSDPNMPVTSTSETPIVSTSAPMTTSTPVTASTPEKNISDGILGNIAQITPVSSKSKPTSQEIETLVTLEKKISPKVISKGSFVVVKYERMKRNTKKLSIVLYVGQVQEKYVNRFKVKFLMGYKGSCCKFVFPQVDDYDTIKVEKIVRILPDPEVRRGIYNFGAAII